MAKKMKPPAGGHSAITAEDFVQVVKDINRLKDQASEASGLAGKRTQQAVDQHGLEKTALTFTARLDRMEPAKRQGILRALLRYSKLAGHFAEIDMFDDTVDTLREILDDVKENSPEAPGKEVMDDLVH